MSKPVNRIGITRREALLLSTTVGLGAALSKPAFGSDSVKTGAHQEPGQCVNSAIGDREDAVRQGARVCRWRRADIQGCSVWGNDGRGESMAARPPAPWSDEYPALAYGANCPQTLHPWTSIEQTFLFDWDDGWQSEDMLKLNIWTPSLTGKRPVMLYMHGGGFSFGSSYELPSHDGAQMARHHEVVQVSVNHRLNILGFLDAAEIGGSAYEDSANVGMTDLVAALRWGSGEHREFRWRSESRDDLRAVERRIEGDDPDGYALGGGPDPSGGGAVGGWRQHSEQGSAKGTGAAGDERARACAE